MPEDQYPKGFEPEDDKPRTSLVTATKEHVAGVVAGWDNPRDDITPQLVFRDRDGGIGVMMLLIDMDSEVEKDYVADMMTATLACSGASEACFLSSAWVSGKQKLDKPMVMPRDDPDRIEAAIMVHHSPDGEAMHQAVIHRTDDKPPTLAEWVMLVGDRRLGGRFANAVHRGLQIGSELPPEMVGFIKSKEAAGEQEDVVKIFMRAMKKARDYQAAGTVPEGFIDFGK